MRKTTTVHTPVPGLDASRTSHARAGSSALCGLLLAIALALPASGATDAAPSAQEVRPLLVGTTIPSVTVTAADGTAVDLLEDARKKPSILVFYRGGW